MAADVLVVSPHPDDAEMGCGGSIAAMVREGLEVAILYMTHGEMGTRGDVQTRERETAEALRILGVRQHAYAGLPDSAVFNSTESRLKVIKSIREQRPRLLLAPWHETLHPDHVQTAEIVRDAAYMSGLLKIDTGQARHRPQRVLWYPLHVHFDAILVLDITETFEQKMEAVRAYSSQFHNPKAPNAPDTLLSAPDFLDRLAAQSRHFGSLIGKQYGEGFRIELPISAGSPAALLSGI